MQVDQQGMIM